MLTEDAAVNLAATRVSGSLLQKTRRNDQDQCHTLHQGDMVCGVAKRRHSHCSQLYEPLRGQPFPVTENINVNSLLAVSKV